MNIANGIIEKCTRTVGEKTEIDEIMRPTLIIQKFYGYHILDPSWTWKISFPYQIGTILLVIYIFGGTLDIVRDTNDVSMIAEASFTALVSANMLTRYYFFINTRREFQNLYIALKTSMYTSIKLNSEDTLKNVLKKTRLVVNFVLFMCVFPVAIYILTVLWYYVNGERVTMSRTTSILMPMETPFFEIGLVLHIIYMFEVAITINISNIWFLVMIMSFCTSCDITVKHLDVKKEKNESHSQYTTRLCNGLRKFYESHVKEIEFLYNLNSMFKWLALLPLITTALSMCIIFLLMSKGVEWRFNLIPVFGELFAYNWFGEKIKDKADNWKNALLEFDWINLPRKDKKCYYIIVCYIQKEFGVKTAIGTDLSLLTMSSALKFSYQTFTVLNSVDV